MPRYSIIIPAFDEEAFLGATLSSLKMAMDSVSDLESGEVIVADNNSTDRTAEIAREHGARVVFEPENQIARARNAGARAASPESEWLIFLDADTTLPPETLRRALELLSSGNCCGGGAIVKTDHPMPLVVSAILGLWNRMASLFGLAAGCFIFCRRDAFEAIGGFDEQFFAGEEVWLSNALRKWGKKRGLNFHVFSDPAVVTSSRKAEWFSPGQFLRQLGVFVIFPWATRSRRWCSMWYRRPQETKKITP